MKRRGGGGLEVMCMVMKGSSIRRMPTSGSIAMISRINGI